MSEHEPLPDGFHVESEDDDDDEEAYDDAEWEAMAARLRQYEEDEQWRHKLLGNPYLSAHQKVAMQIDRDLTRKQGASS